MASRLVQIEFDEENGRKWISNEQIKAALRKHFSAINFGNVVDKSAEVHGEIEGQAAIIRLKNLEIAHLEKRLAHAKMDYWGMKLNAAHEAEKKAEGISRGTIPDGGESHV